jgi:predicted alpha/beta superfamily hydrolase
MVVPRIRSPAFLRRLYASHLRRRPPPWRGLGYNRARMTRSTAQLFVYFLGLCWLATGGARADDAISIGIASTIRSGILNEERAIQVYLPSGYERSKGYRRYPVLYLRDGAKFFHSFTGVVQQLTSDATPHAPEMIVVAITETDRVRDSSATRSLIGPSGRQESDFATSGGGQQFLRFIAEELVPYVDATYSTSAYRIYCGYSFTGLSVVTALFDAKRTFDAYIAIDPSWWWDDYVNERNALTAIKTAKFRNIELFMAASGEPYPRNYFIEFRSIESLAGMLEKQRPVGVRWQFKRYDDESHHSMPARALYDGLSYIFRGHKPPLDELYNSPDKLRERYRQLSERLGVPIAPKDDLLNFFGYQFLYRFKEPDKALRYLEMNAQYYPASANVWDSLGEAYAVKGDKTTSAKMYEKALALDPANENAKKKLLELRGAD